MSKSVRKQAQEEESYFDLIDVLIDDWHRERPDLDPDSMNVVGRIFRVSRQLNDRMHEILQPHGLLYSEFDVLATLRRSGDPYELTPTQLQDAVVLTSGAMTALLDRLTSRKLIKRNRNAEDRRSTTAQLTGKGLNLANKLIGLRFEEAALVCRGLNKSDRNELARILRAMEHSLHSV
ncbi:MAG: MarR family transcriptional regulator [Pseudomonadota bacterium]